MILAPGELNGGTRLTRECCRQLKKPHVVIDAAMKTAEEAAEEISRFVEAHRIAVLNVAGPRASGWGQGEGFARDVMAQVLTAQASG